jgi:hypothetical protein
MKGSWHLLDRPWLCITPHRSIALNRLPCRHTITSRCGSFFILPLLSGVICSSNDRIYYPSFCLHTSLSPITSLIIQDNPERENSAVEQCASYRRGPSHDETSHGTYVPPYARLTSHHRAPSRTPQHTFPLLPRPHSPCQLLF